MARKREKIKKPDTEHLISQTSVKPRQVHFRILVVIFGI